MIKLVSAADRKQVAKAAYIHYLLGRWDECISEFRQLVAFVPEDPIAHNLMGDALARKGATAEARDQYVLAAFGYMRRGGLDKVREIRWKMEALDA
jgi:Flp pilus assembly protein TadD